MNPVGGLPLPSSADAADRVAVAGLLDGTFEAVILPPTAETRLPAPVIALGLRSESAGAQALDHLTARAAAPFGGTVSTETIASHPARCLAAGAVVLGFSPCALVVDGALLIGWTRSALARVLDTRPSGTGHGLWVDFEAIARADRELEASPSGLPFERLTMTAVSARRLQGELRWR
jgi:hypothetical protein